MMRETSKSTPAATATALVGHAMRCRIAEMGESAAAASLRPLSRSTVTRLAAELPCRAANVIVAAQMLGVNLAGAIADAEGVQE